jgi:acyl carrier protein
MPRLCKKPLNQWILTLPEAFPGIESPHIVRYTNRDTLECRQAFGGGSFPISPPIRHRAEHCNMASSTFDTVANIIAETCDIPRDQITPESHAIDDLGIDSLDFLDIAFAIDKAFGIKLPLEQWTAEVNEGKATTEQYFVLKNLAERIDGLVAAKGA